MTVAKAKNVRCLVLDVDGVLTDGSLYFSPEGECIKQFNVQDGLGIKLLQNAGIVVGIITARQSEIIMTRAQALGIAADNVFMGQEDKREAFNTLMTRHGLSPNDMAHMGDDLPDLALLQSAGFAISVPNGHAIVREHADYVTQQLGGRGAVREAAEFILHAQGLMSAVLERYLAE